ncbi:hypothetical protein [Candidatus Vidania fulgoroideorum]
MLKTKCKFIFKIKNIDSRKKIALKSKKLGLINKKKKIISLNFKKIKFYLMQGAKLSKGFKKIVKCVKHKKYDIQIL